jgi:hypothetical protein
MARDLHPFAHGPNLVPACVRHAFAVVVLVLAGCSAAPPEQALRETVAELEAAIEARDSGAIEDVLADDFIGPDGMDRAGARRLAQLGFLRNPDVTVALGPLDMDIRGDASDGMHATVVFTAALAGGSGRWLPDSGSVHRVETGWRLDGDAWVLASARWERDL